MSLSHISVIIKISKHCQTKYLRKVEFDSSKLLENGVKSTKYNYVLTYNIKSNHVEKMTVSGYSPAHPAEVHLSQAGELFAPPT